MRIFITGFAGSGKSTAASILRRMGFKVFEVSYTIKREMRSRKIRITPESLEEYTAHEKRLRGNDFAAIDTAKRASKARGDIVMVGFRSHDELLAARKILGNIPLVLVLAPYKMRLLRVKSRKAMRMGASELRMKDRSNINMGMRRVLRDADYIIYNTGTVAELKQNIRMVLDIMNKG